MNNSTFRCRRVAAAIAGALMAMGAGQALATGFQLNDQSGSSIGNAFAAGAAFTDDASAMWWNPAALSKVDRMQAIGVLHVITPSIKFHNEGSVAAFNQPLGGEGGDAGGYNFVPNGYFAMPINKDFAFGVGLNSPFGLTTEYDDNWIGRYQAIKSSIMTINVNPSISWRVTPTFSVGAGFSYMYLDAKLTQAANYSGALIQALPVGTPASTIAAVAGLTPGLDSKVTIKGNDDGWGWNVGLAWDATPQLRLAAAYRSEVKFKVDGTIGFENPQINLPAGTPPVLAATIAALSNGVNTRALYGRDVTSDIKLPQIANVSFLYRINPQWEVMGDVQWTGWSSIPQLKFDPTDGSTLTPVNLQWDDTVKYALGASYRHNDQWKFRFGVAHDETPVTEFPTPRLPDSNRWWFAVGTEYKMSPNLKLDAGFVWINADDAGINRNEGSTASYGLLKGNYESSTWILSMQATYTF